MTDSRHAATLTTIAPHTRVDATTVHTFPRTIDELSAILRYANQQGLTLHPTGNNTKAWGRNIEPAITLHTTHLNAIKEHGWQDMTATAEAGATWASLQSALAQHNQFVALDPLFADTATIGGIVAANDSGALRRKYGSLRDLIIGMTIVLADGTIARTGGKVVKNVAGYDLHKLMTGAFGTLGIIAEVTFRLHALPQHIRSFTIQADSAEPLGELLLTLSASQLSLHALQLRSTANTFALDIALATMPSVLDQQRAQLHSLALPFSVEDADAAVWNARESLHSSPATLVKATMLPTNIANISTLILALGGQFATQSTGIMTATLPLTSDLAALRGEVESGGGHLTILSGPQQASTQFHALPVMQAIKRSLDPNRILNPDHFAGI